MVTHLLARFQGFLLTLSKCFQWQSTWKTSGVCSSAIFNTYCSLRGLDYELFFFFHMEDTRIVIRNKGQLFITFLFGLWFVFQYVFQSLFSINPNCLFFSKKQRNARVSFSCLSLSLFQPTVLSLLREVCVSTCPFLSHGPQCLTWEGNCCSYWGNEEH